jgi:hypothetical protein
VGSIPDEAILFFNWPDPSRRTMALGSTQPLTEMSSRNLHEGEGEGRPALKTDNLTSTCQQMCRKYGEPRLFTTLWPIFLIEM